MKRYPDRYQNKRDGGKNWFGLVIILVGVVLLLKKLGVFYIHWHTLWPVILIAVGLMIGIKNRFTNHAWWILMLVGGVNLIPEFEIMGRSSSVLVFPALLIILGFAIVMNSGKKKSCSRSIETVMNDNDSLYINVTFGGRKEIVTSKNFKGGSISTTFGGTEVSLVQADTPERTIELECKVSFGEIELIVPSHWEIQNEINTSFGNVEDHRTLRTGQLEDEKKILVLKGSCTFGNIELKSY